MVGNFCFFYGDYLVASKFFVNTDKDAYVAAGILARALPQTVAPLLTVLFTSRSGERHGAIVPEQLKLIGLSGLALVGGAICLFALRMFCLNILGRYTPEAAGMIGPFATGMVLIGLLQSFAYWALASRWAKISLVYGALGIGYWLALLLLGRTPTDLLHVMPIAAGLALAVIFSAWFGAMRSHKISAGTKRN